MEKEERQPYDHVKQIFREHNQEADHWANLGPEGQRKVFVDRSSNSETWKAVKGFWDVSAKDNGKSQGSSGTDG